MIPTGELRLMLALTNPPRPLGLDVIADGKTIAVLSLEEFDRAAEKLAAARKALAPR